MRAAKCLLVVALGVAGSGCLLKDTRQTWYVEAGGGVTWVVDEKDVRSDAQAVADRLREEGEYWLAVQQERHPVAAGLRELSGLKPRTVVLRAEAPFSVRTDVKFSGLDVLGQRLIAAIGGTGTSIITREAGRWEWTLVVRDPSALGNAYEPSEGATALLGSLDALEVVLVAGRFEEAEGFELSSDRRIAKFNLKEPGESYDGRARDEVETRVEVRVGSCWSDRSCRSYGGMKPN